MSCKLVYQLTTHMWLLPEFVEHLLNECITLLIAGFHVTNFLLWKLGYLLDEAWLEEDVVTISFLCLPHLDTPYFSSRTLDVNDIIMTSPTYDIILTSL